MQASAAVIVSTCCHVRFIQAEAHTKSAYLYVYIIISMHINCPVYIIWSNHYKKASKSQKKNVGFLTFVNKQKLAPQNAQYK